MNDLNLQNLLLFKSKQEWMDRNDDPGFYLQGWYIL
jgi:hypothetical protein